MLVMCNLPTTTPASSSCLSTYPTRHTTEERGERAEAAGWLGRRRQRHGKHSPAHLSGFLQESRAGQVNSLGLAALKNMVGLRGLSVLPVWFLALKFSGARDVGSLHVKSEVLGKLLAVSDNWLVLGGADSTVSKTPNART